MTEPEEPRTLTDDEIAVIRELYKNKSEYKNTLAYVTAAKELTLKKWNGHHPVESNQSEVTILPGTTLKIVMVSRFNDCGLTDDLDAIHGYHLRLSFDDHSITDIRRTRNPVCKNLHTRFELLKASE